jgi:hypothetical protein
MENKTFWYWEFESILLSRKFYVNFSNLRHAYLNQVGIFNLIFRNKIVGL